LGLILIAGSKITILSKLRKFNGQANGAPRSASGAHNSGRWVASARLVVIAPLTYRCVGRPNASE
jgi:hypothetical protein